MIIFTGQEKYSKKTKSCYFQVMYIATFHSHFAAMQAAENFKAAGFKATLRPVPRKVSSSCGTCLSFDEEKAVNNSALFGDEVEFVYLYDGKGAKKIWKND